MSLLRQKLRMREQRQPQVYLSQVIATLIRMERIVKGERRIGQDALISGQLVNQNNAKAPNELLTLQTPHEQKEKRALTIAGIAVVLLLLVATQIGRASCRERV